MAAAQVTADQFIERSRALLSSGSTSVEKTLTNIIRESREQQHKNTFSGEDHFPEAERYLFLLKHLAVVGKAAHQAFGDSNAEVKNICHLQKSMERLDEECGTDIHLVPDTEQKEQKEQIAALDADKLKFAGILKTELASSVGAYADFLIEYARLVYRLNEYQAPPRMDIYAAVQDSLGVSDHFQELLDSIRKS